MNHIYHQILEQVRSGSRIVLATVIRTSGSTPQKPGSSALFGENGLLDGTVGGGILEGEVTHISGSVLITGVSDHYYFNLDTGQDDEGAICGGEAVVLIDANPGKHLKALEEMEQSQLNRQAGYLMTTISRETDNGRSIDRYWITEGGAEALPSEFDQKMRDHVSAHFSTPAYMGFSELELTPSVHSHYEIVFVESVKPLPHLVIAGAGHVGKALAHIGSLLDFEITVIDDRPEYANKENIPDADHLIVEDIGKAMAAIDTGPDTYIVIVTRGHNHDADALRPCVSSNAAYVGMIGSSNKVGIMKKRFLTEGWSSPDQWSRIHTPIGLPIGSKSVQEIAVSISAQLVSVRYKNNKINAG
jgi:xanthine dehydrogenase accessory factor